MGKRMSRRRLLKVGAAGMSAAAFGAAGFWPRREAGGDLAGAGEDNGATAQPAGTDASDTPTAAAEQAPEATADAQAVPDAAARLGWTADTLRQVAKSGPDDRPLVGLTIDDGWTARDPVLDVLKDRGVQPTLFLTGRAVAADPQFIARAIDAGCEVGNHTMDHAWLVDKPKNYIQKDIQDFEDLVGSVAPNTTTQPFMRPSGGGVNQTVIDAAAELGYRPILWSASTGDGSTRTTPDQMVKYALAETRPGSILITHFSQRAVAALPGIIDGLRAKGLEPVSLSRLFEVQN